MKTFGIDISEWQAGIDFQAVKNAGVKFVILRGSYSTRKDKQFETFYKDCKRLNIPIGVYLYSMAKNVTEAKAEADTLILNVLKGKQFEYPIYYDVEDKVQKSLGKSKMDAIIKTFCDALENAGYFSGVYSNEDFYKNYCDGIELSKKYSWWLAKWTSKEISGFPMWQFGGETNFIRSNKIAGRIVDQDYCFVDFPSIIKSKGLNCYGETNRGKVQKRFGLNDETMNYLEQYKYGGSLLEKLASAK